MSQTDYFDYLFEFHESYKCELERLEKENVSLKKVLNIFKYVIQESLKD